ncbi:MAG TPA: DEAD/DEAH box helicase [Nitrososphaera sp.]|jgi:superfamily II DNA or RNA helicase|nr:DEAD/DEAH box helicase [Nitrososphaera sp.]
MPPAISTMHFPFELKRDQTEAAKAWIDNGCRGSVIFSTGTGKTEIAFECARWAAKLSGQDHFTILFLVPRIVLIEQNVRRLRRYGISDDHIGIYYGERKDIREITISTYQSAINNYNLIRNANMVVLDEVHLVSESAVAFDSIFDIIVEDSRKAILGLTATINENDPKYQTILTVVPPVKKYMIKDAVTDGRLAKPIVKPVQVRFTSEEQKSYDEASTAIKDISRKLQAYDPGKMTKILMRGGSRASMAKIWFAHVRKRKELLSATRQKLLKAAELVEKHTGERIMIFSETIDSIQQLKSILEANGIPAQTIHNGIKPKERKEILESWGKDYFPLLSVHTLEIGYDVPQVGIAIIIASTSNMNQVAQRIGRVIRKVDGKDQALVYVVYVSGTKDDNVLKVVSAAVEKADRRTAMVRVSKDKRPTHGQKTITKFS